jgi:hypothetical protein
MDSIENLRLNAKDNAILCGTTSFFKTPSPELISPIDRSAPSPPRAHSERRARLKQNAWTQKALEMIAETPVGITKRVRSTY